MTEQNRKQLIQLVENEKDIRARFRAAVDEMSKMVDEATRHNRECAKFWSKEFGDREKVALVNNDRSAHLLLEKGDWKEASAETYLPYGIDFKEIIVIDCNTENDG